MQHNHRGDEKGIAELELCTVFDVAWSRLIFKDGLTFGIFFLRRYFWDNFLNHGDSSNKMGHRSPCEVS